MRQRLIKPDLHRDSIRMPRRQSKPQIFIPSLACPSSTNDASSPASSSADPGNQIETLLIDEP
jgi:hypothetical protein